MCNALEEIVSSELDAIGVDDHGNDVYDLVPALEGTYCHMFHEPDPNCDECMELSNRQKTLKDNRKQK